MKAALIVFLICVSVFVQAGDIASCNGTVLQRRLALVEFGRLADDYIATKGELPDICAEPLLGISDGIPDLLKGASVCGSSEEAAVYYSCEIPPEQSELPTGNSPVVESCRYSLVDQSVTCQNRSVMTTFGAPD